MPQAFIVDAVVREVRRLEGYPNLSILDLSCGEGEVLSRLAADGCRVRGTHFRADDYITKTAPASARFPSPPAWTCSSDCPSTTAPSTSCS